MMMAVFLSLALQPTPKPPAEAPLVRHARSLLGTPYVFGGRLGVKGQSAGIDCQGTLFYAVEKSFPGCDWRSYSVMPTKTIAREELGAVSVRATFTRDLDLKSLAPGDFIWFLGWAENPAERSIATLDHRPVWVWHTALIRAKAE